MAGKTKENLSAFRELLASRIVTAKLNDVEVADAIGVSKGLVSQLKTGVLAPSRKIIPTLAWALHQTPSALYDDVCLYLKEACLPYPGKPLAAIAPEAKEAIWIVVPPHIDISASTIREAFPQGSPGKDIEIRLFTTKDQAHWFRTNETSLLAQPHFAIKTPSEILLNIEYPLVFLDPENVHGRRVFRGVPVLPGLHLVEIRESPWSAMLLANFTVESRILNVAELASEEQKQTDKSLVILYTNYFPEEEEKLLYLAVKSNLKKKVRYLYLVPTMDDVEAQEARLTYNRLRNKLIADGLSVTEHSYGLIKVDAPRLFRDRTFVLYANPAIDGPPEPKALYRELDGKPTRFREVDSKELARFYVTLLDPLIKDNKLIDAWLKGTDGASK